MTHYIPQIIWIALSAIAFSVNCINQGKPLKGNYSVWRWMASTIIMGGLLYWGGFFDPR